MVSPNTEKILYSGKLIKINKARKRQERTILVTDLALYGIDTSSVKRQMKLATLDGITMSTKS